MNKLLKREEIEKAFDGIFEKNIEPSVDKILKGKECFEDIATSDGYNIKTLEDTKNLIARYYSGKLSPEIACVVESAFKHMKDIPSVRILELYYGQRWHPEHIGREMKCSEKSVTNRAEALLKRAAVAMFGVDALYLT